MTSLKNKGPLCKLLGIEYPIIQGGMVWVSGAKLAGAVSKAGGLGVIGAGSMKPELLDSQIKKAQAMTKNPLAVNIPLLYKYTQEQIDVCLKNNIRIFITSAGSPKTYTPLLKNNGAKVIHVTSTPLLAAKCESAGVDAIVAEGFEAGGHNGRDELTTMVLIPQVVDSVSIPVIAAGGIADARGILASFALGASGVQMGTRFLLTQESSAHQNYKETLLKSGSTDTDLSMRKLIPVRLFKNKFYQEIKKLEDNCASSEEIDQHLGKGRAKLGMLDGDIDEGELEIGQICGMIKNLPKVDELMHSLVTEYAKIASTL